MYADGGSADDRPILHPHWCVEYQPVYREQRRGHYGQHLRGFWLCHWDLREMAPGRQLAVPAV